MCRISCSSVGEAAPGICNAKSWNGWRSSDGAIGIGTSAGSYAVDHLPAAEYGGCGRR